MNFTNYIYNQLINGINENEIKKNFENSINLAKNKLKNEKEKEKEFIEFKEKLKESKENLFNSFENYSKLLNSNLLKNNEFKTEIQDLEKNIHNIINKNLKNSKNIYFNLNTDYQIFNPLFGIL